MSESDMRGQRSGNERRWRGVLQLLAVVAAIAAAIFFARAPSGDFPELNTQPSQAWVAPTVPVIQPYPTSASHRVELTGTVTTLGNVEIVPQVSGEIVWVSENFRNGGMFSAGETLVQIDTTEFDIALMIAQSELDFALGHLAEQREEAARRSGAGRRGAIQQAEARVEIAKDNIARSEMALSHTRIRMPFDGYVVNTGVSIGQVVQRFNSNIGEVFPSHQLRVRARVSTFDLNSLQPVIGREATAVVDGRTFEAEVERVSPVVDIETRLASLYLRIVDQETAVTLPPPGAFANVTVVGPQHQYAYVLPEPAMQVTGSVWLVENGTLGSFTPETLGYTDEGWLVKAFGFGDGVVVGQVAGAREGLPVTTVTAGPH